MEASIQTLRSTACLIVFVIFLVNLMIAVESIEPPTSQFNHLYTENIYEFPNISESKLGEYHLMSTSKFSLSFAHTIGKWSSSNQSLDDPTVTYVEIDRRNPFEISEFFGFGSTFTDADLEIFQRMPSTLVDRIFDNYFSTNGLNFELLRVPIDRNFVAKREIYVKRLIQRPLNKQLGIVAVIRPGNFGSSSEFGSNVTNLSESLGIKLEQLVKSLNNESKVEILELNFTGQATNASEQAYQIQRLATSFNQSTADSVAPRICLADCTCRNEQPWLLQLEESQRNILNQIDIISLTNRSGSPESLCRAYKKYQKPIIFTVAEEMDQFSEPTQVELWQKAEEFIDRMMSLLLQNIVGYLEHSLNSLIKFDENGMKLQKHPAFYAMAHFSRHILPSSKRLAATLCGPTMSNIQIIAYHRPDASILVLLYNSNDMPFPVWVVDKHIEKFNIILPAKSINSILYSI